MVNAHRANERLAKGAALKASRPFMAFALAGALAVGAVGCTQSSTQSASNETAAESAAEQVQESTEESVVVTTEIDESRYKLEYSDRDKDPSYDESTAVKVKLSGDTATIDGDGAQLDGSTVTVSKAGVYVLSGSFTGQVVVNAGQDDKVQLVLDGVELVSQTGCALYVEQADKCFITLADGSKNTVGDASSYTLEEGEDEPDAALFSTCDLTLQGQGSLVVKGNYNDGIKTKDDLVITGGTYDVTAVGDGLVGKDSVKMADGAVAVKAGNDGVKSSKDDDQGKGFVSIDGGTLTIDATDKGVNAVSYLRVEDGAEITVNAGDDALHCDGCARIDGGSLTIDCGDDGVHVEYVLEVNDGTIDIRQCVEGLEGQTVTVNDGVVGIVASDDGINAATPENSTSTTDGQTEFQGFTEQGDTSQESAAPDMPQGQMPGGTGNAGDTGNTGNTGNTGDTSGAPGGAAPNGSGGMPQMPGGSGGPQMPGGSGGAPQMPGGSGSAPQMPNGSDGTSQMPDEGDISGAPEDMQQGGGFAGAGGLMAETDESCVITINGGTITVEAEGDGIDTNGYLYVNGGTTYVSGPTNAGNGSLDYGLGAEVSGGTLIAAGASGMAETFTSGTQAFGFVQVSGNAGDSISVTDASGAELASFVPTKSYQCVIVTAPGMTDGSTYNLVVNGTSTSFQATTSGGMTGMGGMGGFGGGMGGQGGMGGFGGGQGGQGGMGGQGGFGGSQGQQPSSSSSSANGQSASGPSGTTVA